MAPTTITKIKTLMMKTKNPVVADKKPSLINTQENPKTSIAIQNIHFSYQFAKI